MFISPPEKSYGQSLVSRILLFVPVALVLLIAFTVVDFDTRKMPPVGWVIVAVTLGLYVFAWWAISKNVLSFHSEGVSTTGAFGGNDVRWDEISETFFYKMDQSLYVHFGLIGLLMAAASSRQASGDPMGAGQMSLKFSGSDPKQKIAITSSWRNAQEAVRAVLNRVNPRIKPDIQRKVQGGETVMFGPVSLSRQGIGYQQKPQVPFAEAIIKFNGAFLAVKKEGKWLNVFRAPAQKIPNVFVLLDLVEEMKLGGAPRPPDPFMHMAR